jgi:hypothetical protein
MATNLPDPQYGPLVPDWVKPYVDFIRKMAGMTVTISNVAGSPASAAIDTSLSNATLRIQLPSGLNTTIQYKNAGGGTGTLTFVGGMLTQSN